MSQYTKYTQHIYRITAETHIVASITASPLARHVMLVIMYDMSRPSKRQLLCLSVTSVFDVTLTDNFQLQSHVVDPENITCRDQYKMYKLPILINIPLTKMRLCFIYI